MLVHNLYDKHTIWSPEEFSNYKDRNSLEELN